MRVVGRVRAAGSMWKRVGGVRSSCMCVWVYVCVCALDVRLKVWEHCRAHCSEEVFLAVGCSFRPLLVYVCVADVVHLAPSKSTAPRATPTGRTRPQEFFSLSCFLACAVWLRISRWQLQVVFRKEKELRVQCAVLWITRRGPWNGLFLTVTTHRNREISTSRSIIPDLPRC